MVARHLLILLLAGVCHVALDARVLNGSAGEKNYRLVWKLAQGDTLEMERVSVQKQTVKMRGQTFSQDQKTTTQYRLVVRAVRANSFVIDASKIHVETQWTVDGKARKVAKLDDLMKGISFELTVSTNGRLFGFEGYDSFLKKLAANLKNEMPAYGTDAIMKVLRPLHSEDALKESFRDLFGPLPEKDSTWERRFTEPISLFGSLHATAKYTHERAGTIRYVIDTKYQLPKEQPGSLLEISRGDVKSQKAVGTITFDARAGRLIEHRRSMALHGVLYLKGGDKDEPVEFTSENELSIRMK